MPAGVAKIEESRIIADILRQLRRHRSNAIAQAPQWTHDRFVVAATPATTYQLSSIPYGINVLARTASGAIASAVFAEGTDYTVDYSTGVVTVSAALAASDVLFVSYVTTGDLIALSALADGGLALLSDWTQDQGAWALDISNKFEVTGAAGGGTRFGGAFNGFYTLIHNNGAASVHFVANVLHNSSADDGFAVAFNPATGAGYRISWDGGTFHGGIQLYRYTNDTTGAEVANAVGNPISTGSYDAKIEVVYDSATGGMSVYFDSIASGLTTLRISYTDGSPLTGTWFGAAEYFSNLGAGRWWNWVLQ